MERVKAVGIGGRWSGLLAHAGVACAWTNQMRCGRGSGNLGYCPVVDEDLCIRNAVSMYLRCNSSRIERERYVCRAHDWNHVSLGEVES